MGIGWNILDGQGKDSENDNEMVATNGHTICPAPKIYSFLLSGNSMGVTFFKDSRACT
jgi:hypothetical protein